MKEKDRDIVFQQVQILINNNANYLRIPIWKLL